MKWLTYTSTPRVVKAYIATEPHIVRCYNGDKIAQIGQYVVIDEDDMVMVMKKDKFERIYQEVENDLHQYS
jgi:hypothetical protein